MALGRNENMKNSAFVKEGRRAATRRDAKRYVKELSGQDKTLRDMIPQLAIINPKLAELAEKCCDNSELWRKIAEDGKTTFEESEVVYGNSAHLPSQKDLDNALSASHNLGAVEEMAVQQASDIILKIITALKYIINSPSDARKIL